eukprot:gene19817-26502_t
MLIGEVAVDPASSGQAVKRQGGISYRLQQPAPPVNIPPALGLNLAFNQYKTKVQRSTTAQLPVVHRGLASVPGLAPVPTLDKAWFQGYSPSNTGGCSPPSGMVFSSPQMSNPDGTSLWWPETASETASRISQVRRDTDGSYSLPFLKVPEERGPSPPHTAGTRASSVPRHCQPSRESRPHASPSRGGGPSPPHTAGTRANSVPRHCQPSRDSRPHASPSRGGGLRPVSPGSLPVSPATSFYGAQLSRGKTWGTDFQRFLSHQNPRRGSPSPFPLNPRVEDRQPGSPRNPKFEDRQPGSPCNPRVEDRQPGSPRNPRVEDRQPGSPCNPRVEDRQPGSPRNPRVEDRQPGSPCNPRVEDRQPGSPRNPRFEDRQPGSPCNPRVEHRQPGSQLNPSSRARAPLAMHSRGQAQQVQLQLGLTEPAGVLLPGDLIQAIGDSGHRERAYSGPPAYARHEPIQAIGDGGHRERAYSGPLAYARHEDENRQDEVQGRMGMMEEDRQDEVLGRMGMMDEDRQDDVGPTLHADLSGGVGLEANLSMGSLTPADTPWT